MSDNIIPILQKSKLFAGFSPAQLEEVVAHLAPNRLSLKSGGVVYAQGKPADCCWLIRSGNLTVMRPSLRKPFRKMIYHVGSVTGIQGLVDPFEYNAHAANTQDFFNFITTDGFIYKKSIIHQCQRVGAGWTVGIIDMELIAGRTVAKSCLFQEFF